MKYLMFSVCIYSITFLIKYDKCQWKINVQKKIKIIQNLPLRNNLCQYFEKYHVRPLFKHIYTCELCTYGVTLIILCQMVSLICFSFNNMLWSSFLSQSMWIYIIIFITILYSLIHINKIYLVHHWWTLKAFFCNDFVDCDHFLPLVILLAKLFFKKMKNIF